MPNTLGVGGQPEEIVTLLDSDDRRVVFRTVVPIEVALEIEIFAARTVEPAIRSAIHIAGAESREELADGMPVRWIGSAQKYVV